MIFASVRASGHTAVLTAAPRGSERVQSGACPGPCLRVHEHSTTKVSGCSWRYVAGSESLIKSNEAPLSKVRLMRP